MSRLSLVVLLLVALVAVASARRTVFRVEVPSEEKLAVLVGFAEKFNLDLWTEPVIGSVDIMVPRRFMHRFSSLPLVSSVMIEDVDTLIAEERARMAGNLGKAEFCQQGCAVLVGEVCVHDHGGDLSAGLPRAPDEVVGWSG